MGPFVSEECLQVIVEWIGKVPLLMFGFNCVSIMLYSITKVIGDKCVNILQKNYTAITSWCQNSSCFSVNHLLLLFANILVDELQSTSIKLKPL